MLIGLPRLRKTHEHHLTAQVETALVVLDLVIRDRPHRSRGTVVVQVTAVLTGIDIEQHTQRHGLLARHSVQRTPNAGRELGLALKRPPYTLHE